MGGAGCQSEDTYLEKQLANQKLVGAERIRDITLAPFLFPPIIQGAPHRRILEAPYN